DEQPAAAPPEEAPPPKRRRPGRLKGKTARYETRLTSPIEELTSLSPAERAKRTERDLPVVIAAADPKLRKRCARELAETGIRAMPLDDGKEVWQRVSQHRVSALVLDIDFGEGDAKGLLGWLALSKRALPVVVICGESFPTDNLPGLPRMKVLVKPVPADEICRAVTEVLAGK
ncbi:MAG: hypothetical protein ACYSU0_15980, partial [Planctomycetota bacterium]